MRRKFIRLSMVTVLLVLVFGPAVLAAEKLAPEPYYEWKVEGFAIDAPIGGRVGNAENGRKIAVARKKGNCIACHVMPIPEQEFLGNVGPPLTGVASRLTEGRIRLNIVDEKQINPITVMPGYYRDPRHFNQVRKSFKGKTVLTAQEIEDVIAYLMTLK